VIDRAAVLGRRACAALAVCSAVLHGFSLTHTTSVAATALTVVMLAACLSCAHDLWTRGTLRAWVLIALMNLAMVASHAPASAGHHHSGGGVDAAPVHHSTVMTVATTLAVVEVVIAAAVLYYRTRAVRPTSLTVDGRRLEAGPASPAPSVALASRSEESCDHVDSSLHDGGGLRDIGGLANSVSR
jgi:hypothetical protein